MSDEACTLLISEVTEQLVLSGPEVLVIQDSTTLTLADESEQLLIEDQQEAITIVLDTCPMQLSEEDMRYATRLDVVNDNLMYRAEADPGTLDGDAKWRIWRLTIAADDDTTSEWADGSAAFNQVWDDRLSLTYF